MISLVDSSLDSPSVMIGAEGVGSGFEDIGMSFSSPMIIPPLATRSVTVLMGSVAFWDAGDSSEVRVAPAAADPVEEGPAVDALGMIRGFRSRTLIDFPFFVSGTETRTVLMGSSLPGLMTNLLRMSLSRSAFQSDDRCKAARLLLSGFELFSSDVSFGSVVAAGLTSGLGLESVKDSVDLAITGVVVLDGGADWRLGVTNGTGSGAEVVCFGESGVDSLTALIDSGVVVFTIDTGAGAGVGAEAVVSGAGVGAAASGTGTVEDVPELVTGGGLGVPELVTGGGLRITLGLRSKT